LKSRRGDLSGPVLAILVTLVLLAIGATIIAYFTFFAGGTPTPVLSVNNQLIAYKSGNDAVVEVVVTNIGTASVTLKNGSGGSNLTIIGPFDAGPAPLDEETTIAPGSSVTLKFTFRNAWDTFKLYRSASARLLLVDTAGNTITNIEVSIRIIGGG